MMPANKKPIDLMAEYIVEFFTENESLKDKKGSQDDKL